MRFTYFVALLVFAAAACPAHCPAEECTDGSNFDEFIDCVSSGVDACAAASQACDRNDAIRAIAVYNVMTNVERRCCGKKTKKAKTACIAKYRRLMKDAQSLFPADTRKEIRKRLNSGCDDSSSGGQEGTWPAGDIVLAPPYAEMLEFKFIHPGFAASAASGAPWGFVHLGMDLIVAGGSARVIAPADGKVEEVYIYQNEHNGEWQVNLRIRYNLEFVYHLLFEPRARSRAEVEPQFNAIAPKVGQYVKQGDSIGVIFDLSGGVHPNGEASVHFDIWRGEANICPAPYFTSAAQTGMLALVRAKHPGAQLCYP